VAVLAGCGGNQAVQGPGSSNKPAWIDKGRAAFQGDEAKYIYGVGIVSGIQNVSLATQTADSRARNEVAKNLKVTVQSVLRDYMASTTAGDFKKSSEEQYVESTGQSITDMALSGVEIIDHWKDPSDGTLYALAKLAPADLSKNLDSMKELDAQVRDYVKANADKAFANMEQIISKQEQPQTQPAGGTPTQGK
jgi:hypothetical protein